MRRELYGKIVPVVMLKSVEQYLHSVLLLLKRRKGVRLEESCLGIVGVGHVGSRIQRMAEALGMRVLLNDPPRADRGKQDLWICLCWHGNVI